MQSSPYLLVGILLVGLKGGRSVRPDKTRMELMHEETLAIELRGRVVNKEQELKYN